MDFFNIQTLTWVMTTIGFIGFIFAGKNKWWAWYINLGVQILWAIYALATGQPAFLASAVTYFAIFALNAYQWTKDHTEVKKIIKGAENDPSTHILPGAVFSHDLEQIAKTCHETNRLLQIANDEEFISPEWDNAPDWQKQSAISGVKKALEGETPRQLHISWMQQKINDGWNYAPVKDAEQKLHPCLIEYENLPVEQKIKDQMFYAVVNSFIKRKENVDA